MLMILVTVKHFQNTSNIFLGPPARVCRYDVNGFVSPELPPLPDDRSKLSCATLPATGVRIAFFKTIKQLGPRQSSPGQLSPKHYPE